MTTSEVFRASRVGQGGWRGRSRRRATDPLDAPRGRASSRAGITARPESAVIPWEARD